MTSFLKSALQHVGQYHKADDDSVDRLNHRHTVILLVTFTAFISAKQFIGDPISCWTPAQYSRQQIMYTNSICWLNGTYYLPTERLEIPLRAENSEFRIAYYQFIPYVLLIMAFFFYLPHMLWRHVSRSIGYDLRSIIQSVKGPLANDLDHVASQIHIALDSNTLKELHVQHKISDIVLNTFHFSRQNRNRLSLLYMGVKICYLINCLLQFYFLSIFLSFPFNKFGIDWLSFTFNRIPNNSSESKWFPRVVICDFMVRQLGSNQHWMTVQCNLPINLFNEIIFLIIWTWLVFLTCITSLSLIQCIISSFTSISHTFIKKYLRISKSKLIAQKHMRFIRDYLKSDGILVLRIISENTNDIVITNLVEALFKHYSTCLNNENNDDDISNQEQIRFNENDGCTE